MGALKKNDGAEKSLKIKKNFWKSHSSVKTQNKHSAIKNLIALFELMRYWFCDLIKFQIIPSGH